MKKYCTDLSENVMFSYLTLSCHSTHIIKRVNTYKGLRTFPLRHTNDDIVVIMLPTSSSFSLILSPVLIYFSVGSANKNTENLILFLILFYFLLSIK